MHMDLKAVEIDDKNLVFKKQKYYFGIFNYAYVATVITIKKLDTENEGYERIQCHSELGMNITQL